MTVAKIHGAEYPIRKIFSNDFNFKIPLYQRPYSWTTEEAEELFDDLISFIGPDTSVSIDELSPYFLGSIVLIKDENQPDAWVVDGQQRLTTLTILLSALRHAITTPAYSSHFTDYLYQEGSVLEGTPNRYRLTLRERDAGFFKTHVQDAGQIAKLKEMNAGQLSDARQNIRANAILYVDRLDKLPEEQRVRLAQFIVKNCLLVVVSTPDLDSAYRIFTILNDRGLDLSHSDILKSEIIGRIPAKQQDSYNDQWEDTEEELGRDAFSDLFGHIRMIYRKQKGRESVLKEFREYVVKPVGDSKKLIDTVVSPFAGAFATIHTASYESTAGAEQVNQRLKWLNRIDNVDWVPPAILYLARNMANTQALQRFFADLERLAAFLMICRYGINERFERYGKLLEAIEKEADLYADSSPLQLSDEECRLFIKELNGDVYRQVPKRRLYILLRLDSELSDGSATYDHGVISIEHVLPQNPPEASQWCEWFPTPELRDRWVHRLGNLLLLNHRKNSSASNYDFEKKKTAYFAKGGVSPFPLTTQAIGESEWTVNVVWRRQATLLVTMMKAWRIDVEIPDEPSEDIESDGEQDGEMASFHAEIIPRLEARFGNPLERRSRALWSSSDDSILVSCQVSKKYEGRSQDFWFGLKRATKEALDAHPNAYCAFGLGSPDDVVLLPYRILADNLERLNTTPHKDGGVFHWHISFRESFGHMELLLSPKADNIDVTEFLLSDHTRPGKALNKH